MVVIVVVASVMVYAWSTGLLGGLLVSPQVGKEALNAETYSFTSNNVSIINIRNTGTASAALVTYYVKNNNGATYSYTNWPGPTVAPNNVTAATISIGNACGVPTPCSLSGTGFVFTAGNSYTVTVVTSRNNQFVFTVVKS